VQDVLSHPHGDEFFVMLPNTSKNEAVALKEKVIENFTSMMNSLPPDHFFYEVPKRCELGASIGVAYHEWSNTERQTILELKHKDAKRQVGTIIKETRLLANDESQKIKKEKKVIREEARRRSRIARFSSKLHLFGSLKMF
jgi:GGDEF domain-containing protein